MLELIKYLVYRHIYYDYRFEPSYENKYDFNLIKLDLDKWTKDFLNPYKLEK